MFVGVRPIENFIIGELIGGQLLKGGARQIERVLAVDILKRQLCLVGFDAFLSLVDDEKIELQSLLLVSFFVVVFRGDPAQFIIIATKIEGTLEILQGNKGDHAFLSVL